jgi:hypothetical protein
MRAELLISENDSWVRLRRDPESKSGIFPVRLRNNHVALFLSRRKGATRANRLRHDVATVGERRAAPAGMPAPRKGIVHVRRRDRYVNRHDSEEMPGFPRGYGSRQCLEHRYSRFRFAHVGACVITAVAVRGPVECLQRLLLKVQTVAVASEAMMSEWRRRVGLNPSTLNDSKMRMPIGRAGRHHCGIWFPAPAPIAGYLQRHWEHLRDAWLSLRSPLIWPSRRTSERQDRPATEPIEAGSIR